jgi:hypothetical protein
MAELPVDPPSEAGYRSASMPRGRTWLVAMLVVVGVTTLAAPSASASGVACAGCSGTYTGSWSAQIQNVTPEGTVTYGMSLSWTEMLTTATGGNGASGVWSLASAQGTVTFTNSGSSSDDCSASLTPNLALAGDITQFGPQVEEGSAVTVSAHPPTYWSGDPTEPLVSSDNTHAGCDFTNELAYESGFWTGFSGASCHYAGPSAAEAMSFPVGPTTTITDNCDGQGSDSFGATGTATLKSQITLTAPGGTCTCTCAAAAAARPALSSNPSPGCPDHYQIELKAWIPYATIVDPLLPVPVLATPSELAGSCLARYRLLRGPGLLSAEFAGDNHTGYAGNSDRVTVTVGFDWDGTTISNVSAQTHVPASPTHLIETFREFLGRSWTCPEQLQAQDAANSSAGGTSATLTINSGNPFFNLSGVELAPPIYSVLTASFSGPTSLTLAWTTSLFPSHGFTVTQNGTQLYQRITWSPTCLDVHGVHGAVTLAALLNARDNQGSVTVDTNGSYAPLTASCATVSPQAGVTGPSSDGVAPVNGAGRVQLPNVVSCGSTSCTVQTTATSRTGGGAATVANEPRLIGETRTKLKRGQAIRAPLTLSSSALLRVKRGGRLHAVIKIALVAAQRRLASKTVSATLSYVATDKRR